MSRIIDPREQHARRQREIEERAAAARGEIPERPFDRLDDDPVIVPDSPRAVSAKKSWAARRARQG